MPTHDFVFSSLIKVKLYKKRINSDSLPFALNTALVRPPADSQPQLIHQHSEEETLLLQTNFTYYIQQAQNTSVIQLISWCQCPIRHRGLF